MPAELCTDCAGRGWSPVYKALSEPTVRSSLVGLLQRAPRPQPKGLELKHRPPKNPQLRSTRLLSEAKGECNSWVLWSVGVLAIGQRQTGLQPNPPRTRSCFDFCSRDQSWQLSHLSAVLLSQNCSPWPWASPSEFQLSSTWVPKLHKDTSVCR